MAIKVSENGRLFTLQTKDSSYQMFADDKNVLLHLYYGEKIGEENLSGLIFCTDMGFAGNPEEAGPNRKYSLDTLPQEIPGSGVGDFRDDMIEIRHADGSFAADFRFDSFEILDHSYAIPGMPALYDTEEEKGETLVITMTEKASDIVLKLFYGVFEKENVITRAARLENHGETAIELEKMLSFSMDLMYENYEMIYFSGRHAMERTAERIPVQHAKVEIGSTRGTSSHHYNPAVRVRVRHTVPASAHASFTAETLLRQHRRIRKIRPVFRWVFIRPISASIWKKERRSIPRRQS